MKVRRTMRQSPSRRRLRRSESGYALMMALFMVILMIIGADLVMRNLATEGRRQREAETIWRGQQYVRAIRLYYQKTGHYPQTLEDLQKGLPELHFLRPVAYKDPMNRPDGEWRMIYVNPAGQIIGSVRYATLQQMALLDLNGGQIPTGPGVTLPSISVSAGALAMPASSSQGLGAFQTGIGAPSQGTQGTSSDTSTASTTAAQNPSSAQSTAIGQAAAALAQLKPTGPVDGPVIGAFLTGVGSKMDAASVKVYHGGKKYLEWEFIWNPVEEQARAVQQGLGPQAPQTGQPGLPIGPGGIGIGQPGSTAPLGGAIVQPPAPGQPSPQ